MGRHVTIELSPADRDRLERICRRDATGGWMFLRARVLLLCDRGPLGPAWPDSHVAEAMGVSPATVAKVKRLLAGGGLEAVFRRTPRRVPKPKPLLDSYQQRLMQRLIWSPPPAGLQRWTLRTLAEYAMKVGIAARISKSTVANFLKSSGIRLTDPRPVYPPGIPPPPPLF